MSKGWASRVIFLAVAIVTGCQATTAQRPRGARLLTVPEMDAVTAGSVAAADDAAARALGSEAKTSVSTVAAVYSGSGPLLGVPYLNYANSQAAAAAGGNQSAQARLSSTVSIGGANGGASITATATGVGTDQAQAAAQFYGTSATGADVAFGSVTAAACCGSASGAQVSLVTVKGGPYSKEIRAAPVSDTPGQVESRIDITVASSARPILDQAEVSVAGAPTRASPKY